MFRGSKRSSSFLEFVVDRALTNRWEDLKERTIAVEVFSRPPEVDLTEDTIVRVGAREVRKRLAQFYMSREGADAPVRIDLIAGTYVPQFHIAAPELPVEDGAAGVPAKSGSEHSPRRGTSKFRTRILAVGALALVAVLAVLLTVKGRPDEIAVFWKPILDTGAPVLVSVASPVVYQPSLESWRKETALFKGHPPTIQAPFEFPEQFLDGSQMVRVRDQFVGYGDLVSVAEVTTFLTSQRRGVKFRLATRVEISDLRDNPTVMIGAFTNRWTTELSHKMRFHFNWGDGMTPQIEDWSTSRIWSVPPGLSDPNAVEDYFLVTRIVNSPTGKPFLVLAGLKQAGTEAASHLITTLPELQKVLKSLEPGWQKRNLQLVLRDRVVGGRPAEIELLAHHSW